MQTDSKFAAPNFVKSTNYRKPEDYPKIGKYSLKSLGIDAMKVLILKPIKKISNSCTLIHDKVEVYS